MSALAVVVLVLALYYALPSFSQVLVDSQSAYEVLLLGAWFHCRVKKAFLVGLARSLVLLPDISHSSATMVTVLE
ncbi:MAG: hypothetical protein J2P36_00685 [Ktedonobacteraceae bacterium]|nr:hypothetical protein [Ktedonobacteraceae bacterium]